jgi:heptosyltransferase-2
MLNTFNFELGNVPELEKISLNNFDLKDAVVLRSPNWLGDAIMTFPALMCIKKLLPANVKLIIITPPNLKKLYDTIDEIDQVISLEKAHSMWSKNDVNNLKEVNAGAALLFNNSPRDVYFLKKAGIKRLFGAAARFRGFFMTKAWKFPKRIKGMNNLQHSDKYLAMAYALGATKWEGELPTFNFTYSEISDDIINFAKESKLLIIAPGAAYGPAKRWPAEYFTEVAKQWINKNGKVIAIGTQNEKPITEEISNKLNNKDFYNLACATSLIELMYLLKNCKLCIANDSGTMHLSAGLGGEGIAIYGSTAPTATAPISKKWTIMYNQLDCSPCFKRECPLNTYQCLKQITPEMIIDKFNI